MINGRNLDIDALRSLVVVADLGSFSLAAAQLGRSQSAISLQLKKLEESLGQTLLQRVQGRLHGPTEEGRTLLAYARQMLRLNDEAWHSLGRDAASGSLRIGLPEELMESGFAPTMARFRQALPRIRVLIRSDLSLRLLQGLEAGELDLAVYKSCDAELAAGESLLWREPLQWLAAEDRGEAADWPTPLPLALFGENCVFRRVATAALAAAGREWQLHYSGSSLTGLRQAVLAGLGVTALPRSLLIPGLRPLESGLPPLPEALLKLRHATAEPSPPARRFVALLGEEIRRLRS